MEKEHAAETGHSYTEDHGLTVNEETQRTLGVKLEPVTERVVPLRLETIARLYAPGRATAWIETNQAAELREGGAVQLLPTRRHTASNELAADTLPLVGKILRLDRQMESSLGQVEVLMAFDETKLSLAVGEMIPVALDQGPERPQLVVPSGGVLPTGAGDFVFTSHGSHFHRERVTTAARAGEFTVIAGGLRAGQKIVTHGAAALWHLELQATKAGAGCGH